jgi:lysophospholipase L1-like esterase
VIVYGTSITQGGCASRPGMAYTNILSRRLQREVINLGFSGNGRGEPELAHLLAEIPRPGLFLLDYEANTPSTEDFRRTLPAFIGILRAAHPTVPILLVSQIRFAPEAAFPARGATRLERRAFQQELVADLQRAGDNHITFLDGETLLPAATWDECTVDGVHPTDLGFLAMANALAPAAQHCLTQVRSDITRSEIAHDDSAPVSV